MIRRFGDFLLDEACFELTRSGQRVELEPRAFELLAYLARHPRRVVTKEELVREVWQGKFVSDAAVTYSVGAVRRAIAGDPTVTLATVHGRGYRLDADVELVPTAADAADAHDDRRRTSGSPFRTCPDGPPALETETSLPSRAAVRAGADGSGWWRFSAPYCWRWAPWRSAPPAGSAPRAPLPRRPAKRSS